LAFAVFLILIPVADIQLSLDIIVFSLALLHAFIEFTLVALFIGVEHVASSMRLSIKHLALIYRPIRHIERDNILFFLIFVVFFKHVENGS
jgi:hypothetical protein